MLDAVIVCSWFQVFCLAFAPVGALATAILAIRVRLDPWTYLGLGALYSASLLVPWFYLLFVMHGKSLPRVFYVVMGLSVLIGVWFLGSGVALILESFWRAFGLLVMSVMVWLFFVQTLPVPEPTDAGGQPLPPVLYTAPFLFAAFCQLFFAYIVLVRAFAP